jgi:hypothetical protein
MCSYNEQDWTELATLSEAAGADALEVCNKIYFLKLFRFCLLFSLIFHVHMEWVCRKLNIKK